MITLETTITHTEKKMLKLETPAFWKDPVQCYDEWIGVLNEKTFVRIMRLWDGEVVDIRHSNIERDADKVLEAQQKWNPITEQEFMQAYDDAWESMRLQPKLVTA